MPIIPDVAAALQQVFGTRAHALGRATGFVQRASKCGGAQFVQTLVFSYLANPHATLHELSQTAAVLGVDITPEGLTQRFTPAAARLLERVVAASVTQLLAADPLAIPLLQRFAGVYLEDSTVVALPPALAAHWPGCGNASTRHTAALKVNLRVNLSTGAFAGCTLHAGRVHDRTAAQPVTTLPPRSLLRADLGYFNLVRLGQLAAQDAYFLSRLQANTVVFDAAGRRWPDLAALLERQDAAADLPVLIGASERLPVRLLAVRVPQAVADERRRKLRAAAKKKGQAISARRLALAAWTIYITNVPVDVLPLSAALVLARARWQIELLFKLWKSHGRIDESRSRNVWRVLCDVYAKLLAMIVQQWVWLVSVWAYPDRSLGKAAHTVQKYAMQLAQGMGHPRRMVTTITAIARCLTTGCRMNRRKQQPHTYQLLVAVTEYALA